MDKPRLAISFSGGETSAVMTKKMVEQYRYIYEIVVTFANTSREDDKTLEFVHNCDQAFGWHVVWLEAEVSPIHGVGVRSRIVDYATACRDGSVFEAYIAKYGIPNMGSPQCTTRLKENVMDHYRRSIGWLKGTYDTAIGIRADEAHRVSARAAEQRFIYPLVDLGWTKPMVKAEVATWGFSLGLKEYEGNCVDCWKKSFRKLGTIAQEAPERFEWTQRMQDKYGSHKVTDATRSPCGRRLFFRGHRTVEDILALPTKPGFKPFVDGYWVDDENPDPLDHGVGCGESCEVGSDERYGNAEQMEIEWI